MQIITYICYAYTGGSLFLLIVFAILALHGQHASNRRKRVLNIKKKHDL